jgi:ADP-ribosyl-[dinitrogen reductase] hydrolase
MSGPSAAIIAELEQRGLLPPAEAPERALREAESWSPVATERAVGSLLGGAMGDALGRPMEGSLNSSRGAGTTGRSEVRDFVAWRGWSGGPRGTYTDDTQLTSEVARVLLERGWLDPERLGELLVAWLPVGRGKGAATVAAVHALASGTPWHRAGTSSAGNGAAMRVAPIGIARSRDAGLLRREAALSSLVTHASPLAVSSSIVMAGAVAWCAHRGPDRFDIDALLRWLDSLLVDFPDPGAPDRQAGGSTTPVRLMDRIREWLSETDEPVEDVMRRRYSGAYVLESLPAALWCFVHAYDDPERAIVIAANRTRDSDTIASMTGQLVGALHGTDALPARWRDDLEDAALLADLGRRLAAMAG